jgi:hypothetical protein
MLKLLKAAFGPVGDITIPDLAREGKKISTGACPI